MAKSPTQFCRGRNVLIDCALCGKKTHSEIDGIIGLELCRNCREECEAENEHNDYHDAPVTGCKFCEKENTQ